METSIGSMPGYAQMTREEQRAYQRAWYARNRESELARRNRRKSADTLLGFLLRLKVAS